MREFIQQTQEGLSNLSSQMNTTRNQVQQNTTAISQLIENLTQVMGGLREQVGQVVAGLNNLSSATSQNRRAVEQETQDVNKLWEAYKKMGVEVDELNLNLKTLTFTDKEYNKVIQLASAYNEKRTDSYTALSEKYRAVKILIDNMTVAERENTAEGRAFVAMARDMYEQMNLLQQRTGKYQLQVGDYSKAMTGLNIATNQVVRELPVLANGVSMFAIAISNNIPILVDNIMQVRRSNEAYEAQREQLLKNAEALEAVGKAEEAQAVRESANAIKTTSVVAGLAKAIFSWQTALVLVLTVLPGLIRNIEKKKKEQEEEAKAQKEVNEETKEAVREMKSLDDIYRDIRSAIQGEVTELEVLKIILDDTNRSWEDRVDAGKRLKQVFDEELEGFTAEEIAMGNAAEKMQLLTEEIYNQAKARASLNKITELTQKMIELEGERDLYGNWQMGTKTIKEYAEELDRANKEGRKVRIGAVEMEYVEKYRAILADMKSYQGQIDALAAQISPSSLLEKLRAGGKGGANGATEIADYYWEVLEMSARMLEDGLEKDLALLEVAWLKEQHGYNENLKALLELRDGADEAEREEINNQISNIVTLLQLGEQRYNAEYQKMIRDRVDSYEEVVEAEVDAEEETRKRIARTLNEEKVLRDEALYQKYEASDRERADKDALNKALLESERKYWDDYLEMLRAAGVLTISEYNNIMAKLARTTGSDESGLSRGRKGRKYGGVVEAILAQTKTYGEGNKFGQGILKEEYTNFVTAVDSALKTSMKYMDEWMDKRLEMAEIAVEAAEKEVDAAKTALDYELEARNQGYANSVDTARKELELQRQNHKKALEEKAKVEEEQRMIDTATQISSLVTATANIWAAYTKAGMLGPFLAAAATAAMWGAFAAAQTKAAQVTKMKSQQYGEGTVQLLEGGSHASGHDIDMGVAKDGTRRRAEGGEFFAIINKRNSRKYRKIIPDVINSFNDGTFGEKYYNANAAMGDFALGLLAGGSPTDVSKLERDVRAIREQGDENRYVDSRGNMVIRYKNLTRKYRKG